MTFVKCGSKMFDPRAVTAVQRGYDGACHAVTLSVPGSTLTFRDDEAEAVWDYFVGLLTLDLTQKDKAEAPVFRPEDHYPRVEWDSNQREET